MDINDIKTIIELMKASDLTHFELERDGEKLVLKKKLDTEALGAMLSQLQAAAPPAPVAPAPAPTPQAETPAAAPSTPARSGDVLTIKSPMVGTFYRAPSPGAEPFAKVGDYVEADTTVCIIEAMKVMNEIKAEVSGRITRIAVEDATPVAYGQVLFEVTP